MSPHSPSTRPALPTSPHRATIGAAAGLVALVLSVAAPPAEGRAKRAASSASVAVTSAAATGASQITVAGRVTLPAGRSTAKVRSRTKARVTLVDSSKRKEQFTLGLDRQRRFDGSHATRLTGLVTLTAQATISGKVSGKATKPRRLTVNAPLAATVPPPAAQAPIAPAPTAPAAPATEPTPLPATGVRLNGLFRLEPGTQTAGGTISGSRFRMATSEGQYLSNANSTLLDQTYTPLRPGAQGGLRTDAFQEPADPPFAEGNASSGNQQEWNGDALTDRLVLPENFFGVDFTIVTAAVDPQSIDAGSNEPGAALTPISDPLPEILNDHGRLGGQISAWSAQWGGLSFNQGAPKPDGTYPAGRFNYGTKALSGTYDEASGRFTLDWRSLIVGGPFDQFTGVWHLEGTFEAAT